MNEVLIGLMVVAIMAIICLSFVVKKKSNEAKFDHIRMEVLEQSYNEYKTKYDNTEQVRKDLKHVIDEARKVTHDVVDSYEQAWRERDFSSYRIYQLEKIQKDLKELMEELDD